MEPGHAARWTAHARFVEKQCGAIHCAWTRGLLDLRSAFSSTGVQVLEPVFACAAVGLVLVDAKVVARAGGGVLGGISLSLSPVSLSEFALAGFFTWPVIKCSSTLDLSNCNPASSAYMQLFFAGWGTTNLPILSEVCLLNLMGPCHIYLCCFVLIRHSMLIA